MNGTTKDLFFQITRTLGAYLRGQFLVALVLSALYAVGFGLLKVPGWPLVALLCGFLNLVPLGTVLGMVFAMALTWAGQREFWQVAGVAGVVAIVSGFESYYLTPRILGRHLGLSPWTVFIALMIGGGLFGLPGLLLAAPAAAVINVLVKFFRERSAPPARPYNPS